MAYIGNIPAESFASFEKQVFTIVNSQTAYTLSHSVTNENDIRLVVNSVVQEPGSGKAYTASGTTLTLSAALTNGTDTMYCVFLGRALQTVNPPNASVGTSQLASEAVTNAKVASSIITGQTAETSIATDDTILIHDTSASALRKMTKANFVSGLGSVAGDVAFRVVPSSAQSISSTATTVIAFGTETFDIGGGFASNKFTVPSGKAGLYFFNLQVISNQDIGDDKQQAEIRVNGTGVTFGANNGSGGSYRAGISISALANLSVADEVDCTYFHQSSGITLGSGSFTTFHGFRISE